MREVLLHTAAVLAFAATVRATQFDPLRVNEPPSHAFALQPLRWGDVEPRGWLRDWALAARHGAASPTSAAFATVKPGGHSVDGWRCVNE